MTERDMITALRSCSVRPSMAQRFCDVCPARARCRADADFPLVTTAADMMEKLLKERDEAKAEAEKAWGLVSQYRESVEQVLRDLEKAGNRFARVSVEAQRGRDRLDNANLILREAIGGEEALRFCKEKCGKCRASEMRPEGCSEYEAAHPEQEKRKVYEPGDKVPA